MTCVLLGAAVLVGLDLLRGAPDEVDPQPLAATPAVTQSAGQPTPTPSAVSPTPSAPAEPVYQLPGNIPASGPGTWIFAASAGKILGTAGYIKRFRVAVETNIAAAELAEFTRMVDVTLGDARSWIAGKQYRLQRVGAGAAYDFTIYLSTGETTRKQCAAGGMDTRQNGVSYTSCRLSGRVVVNLNRWRLSVPEYINNKTPLDTYRSYVINHETGHELGKFHEACPGPGEPAPVMQQQTLGLKGCIANPWPYVNGKRYTGPPVA